MKARLVAGTALTAVVLAAAYAFVSPSAPLAAEGASLLAGKVVSSTGEALAGIPIKAHRDNSTITVAVYTDAKGEYSFPAWSDLTPGAYSVGVELPDFEHTAERIVAEGKPTKVDFTLKSKPLAYEDATTSEIVAALPGTDHQKVLFSQCGNCHSLQWALAVPRPREDWVRVIKKMAGRAAEDHTPGTYAFSQKQFIEPLADYLVSIRGPGSSDKIPFKQRPRPTDAASTNLVVTEYALPRGGERELYMMRGDRRFVWPHDVIMDDKYAYYTDHFSYVLGRVDREDRRNGGNAVQASGRRRPRQPRRGRRPSRRSRRRRARAAIRPPGQCHCRHGQRDRQIRSEDREIHDVAGRPSHVRLGSRRQSLARRAQPGPAGEDRHQQRNPGADHLHDPEEPGDLRHRHRFQGPHASLHLARRQDRSLQPATAEYSEYKTPTPQAGPRRGQIDGQDRLWAAEFYAGQLLMFDPDKKVLKEYPLINGGKPYTAPYAEPYSASVDDKNQIVWTNDFSSGRLYRIDMNTGQSTEYMTPSNYEMRDLKVDTTAARPTVWVPAYRPPSKLVKIQVR